MIATRKKLIELKNKHEHHSLVVEWEYLNWNRRRVYITKKLHVKKFLKIVKLKWLHDKYLVLQLDYPYLMHERPLYIDHNYHDKQREMGTTGRA